MKRLRDSDSESPATMARYKPVFVDTSLETHLLMLVSNSDTVSDIKEKLSLDHLKCCPQFGEIKINSLKVKRKKHNYIMSDLMPIYHAFNGVKGDWFLSADVSRTPAPGIDDVRDTSDVNLNKKILPNPTIMLLPSGCGTSNITHSETASGLKDEKSLKRTVDFQSNHNSTEICIETKSPVKKKRKLTHNHNSSMEPEVVGSRNVMVVHQAEEALEGLLEFKQQGGEHIMSEAIAQVLGVGSDRPDYHSNFPFEEMITKAAAEKCVIGGVNSDPIASVNTKENDPTICPEAVTVNGSNISDKLNENIVSVEDAKSHGKSIKKKKVKKVATEVQDSSCMEPKTKKNRSSQRTGVPAAEEHPLLSDQGKEDDSKAGKSETELGQDIQPQHVESMTVNESNLSAKLLDTSDTMDDAKSDWIKRKKKKSKKIVAKVHDLSSMEHQIEKGEAEKMKEEDQLSLDQDHDMMLPSFNKVSGTVEADLITKEVSGSVEPDLSMKETSSLPNLLDANVDIEPIISKKSTKKKSKSRKPADTDMENLGTLQTNKVVNGSSALTLSSIDTDGKTESMLYPKDKDVPSLKSEAEEASEKVYAANEVVTDDQKLSQLGETLENIGSAKQKLSLSEETFENVGACKKKSRKKNQSVGNLNANFPAIEKENQNVEFNNQAEKHSEITENREKKDKKKRKKTQITTTSDVKENVLIKDKMVDTEIATKDNSNFPNSEQKLIQVASSHVFPDKSEEKLEVNGSSHVQGINFEQYFLHDSSQEKVGSDIKVKDAAESDDTKKTKKVKKPLLSNSTELKNSLKLNDLGSKTDSRGKSATGRRDSALNFAVSNSISKSFSVFGNGLEDKTLSGNGNGLKDKTLSGNGLKDKRAVANSSSKQPTTIVNNKGDKNLQSDLNANKKMAMKTPQSKNLFKKPGSIFKDNSYKSSGTPKTPHKKSLLTTKGSIFEVSTSDDDSGNKVGTVDSDATTCSPSDSSSQSSHSEGESATSQNPTRNELIEEEHGSTQPKLDLSASKGVTLDMILRSSKHFKKAKKRVGSSQSELIASQTEPEPNESQ